MAVKVSDTIPPVDVFKLADANEERYERHKKRVARREAYLATLTPKQRRYWDNHIAYVRWWRKEYKKLSETLHKNKAYIRAKGNNNLETLKTTMKTIRQQQLRARTMLLARMAVSVDYELKMEGESK